MLTLRTDVAVILCSIRCCDGDATVAFVLQLRIRSAGLSLIERAMSKRARPSDHKKELATTEREHQDDAWVESAFASRYNAKPTPKDR